jgi:hypothetical protein
MIKIYKNPKTYGLEQKQQKKVDENLGKFYM